MSAGAAPVIAIDRVTKRFAGQTAPALDALSANIEARKITGLVGPDAAGKTTLIRLMTGLLVPDEGRITVSGFDSVRETASIHEIAGYMPQRFGLYEDLTVQENLDLYADLRGVVGADRRTSFERLLAFTDLGPFTDRLAGQLSGGMKQKLGLACALVQKPRLLLLDEPSVGVDPISRRELWRMVKDLVAEGIAVVWSTAYLDEAEQCDDVLLLDRGELLFSGPPQELTARVENRTYHWTVPGADRRARLARILSVDGVIDGVIQGRNLRIVFKEPVTPERAADMLSLAEPEERARLRPVPPRFEDAFVDILGGGPRGRSALAETMAPVKDHGGAVIEAKGLTKRFGSFTAVDDVSFSIRRGEVFGFLGPNGAGKSTTFKMLCGLLQPTHGSATVAGLDLKTASSQARNRIGYMAQKFSLYGNLSVRQNLDFFSGAYGLRGRHRRETIARMIEVFGFDPYLSTASGLLPLGFKQRLALACAVMHDPAVLFLDEPTSGVDPITRREFWTHINGMVGKGVTIMVSTHFMDEAEYCDRIALIYRGREIAVGSPDELKERARGPDLPAPTLEDAFVTLVHAFDRERKAA
jgi:ABC-2 type transport system ATP-binding protein